MRGGSFVVESGCVMSKSKPVLVVLVADPIELARLVHLASGYLPVKRGTVANSRMVAGLEGTAALSWIDGAEDLEEAIKLLDVVGDMVKSLKWSYHQRLRNEELARIAGVEQQTF